MEVSTIMEMIPAEFYIVAVCLYVLGAILKKVEFVKDQLIILILLVVSLVFTIWKGGFTPDTVMYGIMLTGVPVLFNNIIKQVGELVQKK